MRKKRFDNTSLLAAAGFTAAVALVSASHCRAQSTTGKETATATMPLAFEVASVKPTKPGTREFMMVRPMPGGQRYVATNVPLTAIIETIYRITSRQIVGGPGWIHDDHWDIEAKAEHPSSGAQLHEMFKALLADRFQLRFHRQAQAASAYVLTVANAGSKLKVSESDQSFDVPIKPTGLRSYVGTRVPMSYLAFFLSRQLNTPVVDETALDGYYDFNLNWPATERLPEPSEPAVRTALFVVSEEPGIRVALQKQLGLKLEMQKTQVEIFVIDHVEKPAPN